tara:strand:- start:8191 stop:8589 length:399 start_codon:yes stop_codon:yes gene_type:complete
MVLSTYNEDQNLLAADMDNFIEQEKVFKETKIPKGPQYSNKYQQSNNPFLDKSLRSLVDEFVLTWHKIIIDFLDTDRYEPLKKDYGGEWWKKISIILNILIDIFWKKDRIFYIGVGFVILAFFVFFIFSTTI